MKGDGVRCLTELIGGNTIYLDHPTIKNVFLEPLPIFLLGVIYDRDVIFNDS